MGTIEAVTRDTNKSFQELTDEAFADVLKKHKQPVGFKAALTESVDMRGSRYARQTKAMTPHGAISASNQSAQGTVVEGLLLATCEESHTYHEELASSIGQLRFVRASTFS